MHLEDRIERLEEENKELKKRIQQLELAGPDRFVTPEEAADILGVSRNGVYLKIRSGQIFATKKAGGWRIPMRQFYEPDVPKQKTEHDDFIENMRHAVFS